jgi:hypothetical protein
MAFLRFLYVGGKIGIVKSKIENLPKKMLKTQMFVLWVRGP